MGEITQKQIDLMISLTKQLGRKMPENYEMLTSNEAFEINTRLMQERYASQKKKPIVPKEVNDLVEEELRTKASGPVIGMCFNNACEEIRMNGRCPSENGVELLERARKLISIELELEK